MNNQVINLIHALSPDLDAYNVPSQSPIKVHIMTFDSHTNAFQRLYHDLLRQNLTDIMIDNYHVERRHDALIIHLDAKKAFLCELIGPSMYVSLTNQAYLDKQC